MRCRIRGGATHQRARIRPACRLPSAASARGSTAERGALASAETSCGTRGCLSRPSIGRTNATAIDTSFQARTTPTQLTTGARPGPTWPDGQVGRPMATMHVTASPNPRIAAYRTGAALLTDSSTAPSPNVAPARVAGTYKGIGARTSVSVRRSQRSLPSSNCATASKDRE